MNLNLTIEPFFLALLGLGLLTKLCLSFRFLYKDFEFFSKCMLAASLYCLELLVVSAIAGACFKFNIVFLSLLLVGSLVLSLLAIAVLEQKNKPVPISTKQKFSIASFLVLLFAGIFYLPPSQIVIGGQDPSLYVGAAAALARHGNPTIPLPGHQLFSPEERSNFFKFREKPTQHNWPYGGAYVFNNDAPTIQFDFARGPSYLLALGFITTKAANIWQQRAFLTNTIYCVLAIFCFFLFVQVLLDNKVWSFLATLLFLFCPSEIWFGRATYSETPAQFFLFLSLLHLLLLERQQVAHRYSYLAIALLAAAISFLMRTDHISMLLLLLLCLPLFKAQHLLQKRVLVSAQLFLFGLFFLTVYELQTTGPLYLWRMGRQSILLKEMPWFVCGGLAASLILYLPKIQSLFLTCYDRVRQRVNGRLALTLYSLVVLSLLTWGFVYRPYFAPLEYFGAQASHNSNVRTMNEAIFIRLSVLVGLPIFILSFWGMRSYFLKSKNSLILILILLLIAAYCSLLLFDQKNSPMLYWASRRYLPMLVPFFIAFGIYQLSQLHVFSKSVHDQFLKTALYLAAIIPMWVVGFPLYWVGEMNGALSVVNELQQRLDNKKTVIVADKTQNNESFTLQFLGGFEVLQVSNFDQRSNEEILQIAKRLQQADLNVAIVSLGEAQTIRFASLPTSNQGSITGPYYRLGENLTKFPDTQMLKDYKVSYQVLQPIQ